MNIFQAIGSIAGKVWTEVFSIQIPFIGVTVQQLLIGVFCMLVGVSVIKRIFQGSVDISDRTSPEITHRSAYGNSERKKGKVTKNRRNDEL